MKVLVCGGRDYADKRAVFKRLAELPRDTVIITGGATGADACAESAAEVIGLDIRTYPADWDRFGHAAGPIRNRQMMREERPDLVIAFPGDRGTEDMCEVAHAAKVPVERAGRQMGADLQT